MTRAQFNSKMQRLIVKAKLLSGLALAGNLPVDEAVIKLKAEINNLEAEYSASLTTPSIKHLLP